MYLSPEPLGIGESLKAYAYVDNYPHRVVDVDGLKPRMRTTVTRKDGTKPKQEGVSGEKFNGKPKAETLHPAVIAALPPSNARDANSGGSPSACSEPHALSEHIKDWETRNSPKSCVPGDDDNWRKNLKAALDEVEQIASVHDTDGAAAACPNCSQTISRLARLADTKPPGIAPRADQSVRSKRKDKQRTTSLPTDEFLQNEANNKVNTAGLTTKQADAIHEATGGNLGIYNWDD